MNESLLDAPRASSKRTVLAACAFALVAHAVAAAAASNMDGSRDVQAFAKPVPLSEMIEIEEPPPPPPPPPPQEVEPPPPPKVVTPAPVKVAPAPPTPEPPAAAPAAAQAAQVLAQEPKDEVLDFGETIVQGDSAAYAGGVTEAGGTSARAVRDVNARAGGIEGGIEGGTGTDTSGADRSRPASLAGGAVWDCPFPEEADDEGIDSALVSLRVRVSLDGTLESVDVMRDPGTGFGREARRCARDKRWQPARDRAGNAVAAESVINVRFSR